MIDLSNDFLVLLRLISTSTDLERYEKAISAERKKREHIRLETDNRNRIRFEALINSKKNEREEARAYSDRQAAIELMNRRVHEQQSNSPQQSHRIRIQSDESIANRIRVNVPVNATIIKHIPLREHTERSFSSPARIILNSAATEERATLRRGWAAVMKELSNRSRRSRRGRRASNAISDTALVGTNRLQGELHLLESLDRQRRERRPPWRSRRDLEEARSGAIQSAFEENFIGEGGFPDFFTMDQGRATHPFPVTLLATEPSTDGDSERSMFIDGSEKEGRAAYLSDVPYIPIPPPGDGYSYKDRVLPSSPSTSHSSPSSSSSTSSSSPAQRAHTIISSDLQESRESVPSRKVVTVPFVRSDDNHIREKVL